MAKGVVRLMRSHPVRFAALLGGLFGLLYAVVLELWAPFTRQRRGVLNLLWPGPGSRYAVGWNKTGIAEIAGLLLVEVSVNVLVYALLFALPVGLVVGIRRVVQKVRGQC